MERAWYDVSRFADVPKHWNAFVLACAGCLAVYGVNVAFFEFRPGNVWGYVYGSLAGVLMIAVAALGIRRRMIRLASRRNMRSARMWTQFHFYAGAVCLLLVLMHTGFAVPRGLLNFWLWLFSIWVTLSGFLGVALQKTIPRMLASGLTTEVIFERIPELVRQAREHAEAVLAECGVPVRTFYGRNLAPSLMAPEINWRYYFDITGGIQARVRQFSYLRQVLSADEQGRLDRIEHIYRTKLEMDAHYTLQRALRWWLVLHLPASLVLLLLLVLHLVAVFLY